MAREWVTALVWLVAYCGAMYGVVWYFT